MLKLAMRDTLREMMMGGAQTGKRSHEDGEEDDERMLQDDESAGGGFLGGVAGLPLGGAEAAQPSAFGAVVGATSQGNSRFNPLGATPRSGKRNQKGGGGSDEG